MKAAAGATYVARAPRPCVGRYSGGHTGEAPVPQRRPGSLSLWERVGVKVRNTKHGRDARATGCAAWLSVAILLMMVVGCDKDSSTPADTKTAGTTETHYLAATRASATPVVAVAKMAPAPKPTGPLPAGSSCVTAACHASYASAAHIHGPVAAGACDACHKEDTGGHVYPLKRAGIETCTFCHAVSGTRSHQHAAIQKQGCIACHKPHASETKFLLTADSIEQLCVKCHDLPLKKYAHRPFLAGQCTVCHQPHESDSKMLLRGGDGPQHCFSCHKDMAQLMGDPAHVHKPAGEACTTCHGPHSTDYAHQLKAPVKQTCFECHKDVEKHAAEAKAPHAALYTADGCANCHNPHASTQFADLRDRQDRLCLQCHDKEMPASDGHIIPNMKPALTSKNLHGPIRGGDCGACHDPHGGSKPRLLRQGFPKSFYASFDIQNYALCFSCHDKALVLNERTSSLTNFRDGAVNLHYLHVNRPEKGRTCKTCHAIHGSNQPMHMASGVPFEGSDWSMPIQYEKTAEGGKCAPGCHEPYAYSRKQQLNPTTHPTTGGVK